MITRMQSLPHRLYRAAQLRELDRLATDEYGIPSPELMERAGAAAFTELRRHWPNARRIVVLCGIGNNGGDGYVLARLARADGFDARVIQLGEAARLQGAAARAARDYTAAGGEILSWQGQRLDDCDVIVDALFGIGLDREITGIWRAAIETLNASAAHVLAIDLPSGLHADSGRVLGVAVRADLTVTYIGLKPGLYTGAGPDFAGVIRFAGLDLPLTLYFRAEPAAARLALDVYEALLPARRRGAHKGDYGHVLIVGGSDGMMGAALLAGQAAARAGAGLVSVATRPAHAALLSVARPELMSHGVACAADLEPLLARASVVAIGPGLGRSEWGRELFARVLDAPLPLVVDADALNLLAAAPRRREDWVITPHPGEASRLLGLSTARIEDDRFEAVRALRARYGGIAVLKGAGTLVCGPEDAIAVCTAGNPGMATGGMGDVLAGLIAGLIAQRMNLADAAGLGVLLHAEAGDRAAEAGERGLLPSDLMAPLRALLNPRMNAGIDPLIDGQCAD